MVSFDKRDAIRRGDDANHSNRASAGSFYEVDSGDGASASREHGVDHQDVAWFYVSWKPGVIFRRNRRRFVPLQADVADPRGWQ